jgi:outer membrane immunogenic protein
MRRIAPIVIAAASMIALAEVASAADIPTKAPIYKAAPAMSSTWTGWYLGVNAGGNWGRSETATSVAPPAVVPAISAAGAALINALGQPAKINTSGFVGGVHGGYNYQISQWLVGLEGDFDYFRSAGSRGVSSPGLAPAATVVLNSSMSTDWLLTVRPRVGLVSNNWLFYGTGGLAVTRLTGAWSFSNPGGAPTISETASNSATKAGWVAGGGIETMLTGRWVVGAEYLRVGFGAISANALSCCGAGGAAFTNTFSHSANLDANVVRVRVSKLY